MYCGATPPQAVLHVDHINPVANGGKNDIDNLISSCSECNFGKGSALLTSVPQDLQSKALFLLEAEKQIRGYQDAVDAKILRIERDCRRVVELYELFHTGYTLSKTAIISVNYFIDKLGLDETMAAMSLSCHKKPTLKNSTDCYGYFCGICRNKLKALNG